MGKPNKPTSDVQKLATVCLRIIEHLTADDSDLVNGYLIDVCKPELEQLIRRRRVADVDRQRQLPGTEE